MKSLMYVLLVLVIVVFSVCDAATLPNGAEVEGDVYRSVKDPGHFNIKTSDTDIIAKSEISGTIASIGYLKIPEISIKLGDSTNNVVLAKDAFEGAGSVVNRGIVITVQPVSDSIEGFVIYVNSSERFPAGALLSWFKEGDTITIPTVRKYEYPDNLYKILNHADEWRYGELIKGTR